MSKKKRRHEAGGTPTRRETPEVDALLADLDRGREMFAAAERRARTYLVRRGVIDQTHRDLRSLLRDCLPAHDADPARRREAGLEPAAAPVRDDSVVESHEQQR